MSNPIQSAIYKHNCFRGMIALFTCLTMLSRGFCETPPAKIDEIKSGFQSPPDSAKPGVYWYFMDGNLSRDGMTRDLESMKEAGIAHVVFLEVDVGVPKGSIHFLSDKWLELFKHANSEAKRLGISITLGVGPGWTGSGGPWVKPEKSMQHLVASSINVSGGDEITTTLPVPAPRKPYFGEETLTPELRERWNAFYKDVVVLAFPTLRGKIKVPDIDEKALYYRAPYTSSAGVKPYLSGSAYDKMTSDSIIDKNTIIDITSYMDPKGNLIWNAPKGEWTIMRFGSRNNGAITRPAPEPGLGFESDKFDAEALMAHLDIYMGKILEKIGSPDTETSGGLSALHMDSWEMGSQNWTQNFRDEFIKRRGYDPLPYFPAYTGMIVSSPDITDRFLWDVRQTGQELVLENHAGALKKYSHKLGLNLSIEPYDMNPTADLELGNVADIPMCEFWSEGYGFNSSFSCLEATSVGHVNGSPVIQAEAFTGDPSENWNQYPGSMKSQGDWAFALGINRFFYHTFAHQPLDESLRPGMTMGPYGVHWDRHQTWWPMVGSYHEYIARCQYVLQQGRSVADILYLTPEGAPQVFVPPPTALCGEAVLPDKRGYSFDACSPGQLLQANVVDKKVVFPSGASYQILVLPHNYTMTVPMLEKIKKLIETGATVVGSPPKTTPGLSGYPNSEVELKSLANQIWGNQRKSSAFVSKRKISEGEILWGGDLDSNDGNSLYPAYEPVAELLAQSGVGEDFNESNQIRYLHKSSPEWDIYFLSNKTTATISTGCAFRIKHGVPELWNPLSGKTRQLSNYLSGNNFTTVPLQFHPQESYFVVFPKDKTTTSSGRKNFRTSEKVATIEGPWKVAFDPKWGGPEEVSFDKLVDWTSRPEDGIRYYSGIATYHKEFDFPTSRTNTAKNLMLDLGKLNSMARVTLNGKDLGVVWTSPFQVEITDIVKTEGNKLIIKVANRWPNRIIGDLNFPDDEIKNVRWPEWLTEGTLRPGKRISFSTYQPFTLDSPLVKSGLLGPVTVLSVGGD